MPKSTAPHVSLHLPPGLSSFSDVCVESDVITDSEAPRPLNRLRLNVKCPLFPTKRMRVQEGQSSPKSPAGKSFDASGSSSASSTLSHFFSIDALKNSLRLGKRRATQRSQLDGVEPDTRLRAAASPEPRERTPSSLNAVYDCEPGQSVIIKDIPFVAEVSEPVRGWRKLPPRLPIPKWDID
ncbi:uncharacterized protein EDB91DRAFT_1160021, partial [Suillus paluster]|uniref:uncharacterized protein n=1 Tax=Suillus paluster TaxID=48578 RepID=UPI001B8717BD